MTAVSNAGAAVTFHRHGEILFGGGELVAAVSPVEHLLAAAAGCLALSCRAVLVQRKSTASVEVTANGEKARDAPSRLGRVTLAVRFGSGIDAAEADAIVAAAEELCTVTNTLSSTPVIEAFPLLDSA